MIAPIGPHFSRMLWFIGRTLALFFLFDVVVAVAYACFGQQWVAMPNLPLSIGSGVIGIVLGFRNNNSYARWWEARTLWGGIVSFSQSIGRQTVSFISAGDDPQEYERVLDVRRRLVYYQIAYVNALRCQLRGQVLEPVLVPFLSAEEIDLLRGQQNAAAEIQRRMAVVIQDCSRRGWLGDVQLGLLDGGLTELANAQGGCERLKYTPMPKQFDYFLRLIVHVQCLLLPLGMVANLGLLTPIGASMLGFVFLALEKIGRDLEHPFDNGVHDVALTSICRTIEINLKQYLGETDLPAPVEPVEGVLW